MFDLGMIVDVHTDRKSVSQSPLGRMTPPPEKGATASEWGWIGRRHCDDKDDADEI
jgi:hypothetical protein